ncbi:hypothetical protein [Microbacterium sp. SORGH_AS_0888]|uniref:hypothetical protein n=1 Tax=Microbacterium sp. SORGH_AS_0888 TaxID=3041791 RepID=UPI00277E3376|nr:hypothetical protein [Microbacterium sp. SORGH_AS_0888]MDQ1131153.1 hypothetical protein [Microbacterium sp. SORGH_AS_0888]
MARRASPGDARKPREGHCLVRLTVRDHLGFTYVLDDVECANLAASAAIEYLSRNARERVRREPDLENLVGLVFE